jgi:hypothetical protein
LHDRPAGVSRPDTNPATTGIDRFYIHHLSDRMKLAAGVLILGLLGIACNASYPTEPTDPAPLAELVVHYPTAGMRLVSGAFDPKQFDAYAIDVDRVYTKVTAQAVWSSSDTRVLLQPPAPGVFNPGQPGEAHIVATYRGLQAVLPVVVRDPPSFPFLEIRDTHTPFPTMHLRTDSSLGRQVNEQATWTTSDEQIATVERGRVVGHRAGNVRVIATFDGLSDWYWLSFPPRGSR